MFSSSLILNFHVALIAWLWKCQIDGKFSFRLAGAVKIDTREQYVNPTGLCFPVYKCSRHANVIIFMIFSRMDFALITMKRILVANVLWTSTSWRLRDNVKMQQYRTIMSIVHMLTYVRHIDDGHNHIYTPQAIGLESCHGQSMCERTR